MREKGSRGPNYRNEIFPGWPVRAQQLQPNVYIHTTRVQGLEGAQTAGMAHGGSYTEGTEIGTQVCSGLHEQRRGNLYMSPLLHYSAETIDNGQ
jgi:hypothetical protein